MLERKARVDEPASEIKIRLRNGATRDTTYSIEPCQREKQERKRGSHLRLPER